MEFKKPNRYKDGRVQLTVPKQREAPRPVSRSLSQTSTTTPSNETPSPAQTSVDSQRNIDESSAAQKTLLSKTLSSQYIQRIIGTKKGVIIAAVFAGSLSIASFAYHHGMTSSGDTGASNKTAENPSYQTVLPTGKSISELGGWKRVSPSKNDPVFAYLDAIDGISVSVSQQPLPKSFENNIDSQVAELAKKFNATTKFNAGTTVVYVGTSAKGPQSTIFAKKNLLILIKSQKKIDNKAWEKYANSLS